MSHTTTTETGDRYVALLRGINVGGHHKLPMKTLVALFETVGCRDVKTYIQSGNVVFTAESELASNLPQSIPKAVANALGFAPPIILRSAAEMTRIVADNPYLEHRDEPKTLHIVFLADRPSPEEAGRLDPDRSPPDRFTVRGREIYLHCPNGLARTKLTNAWFDSKLSTISTMRNWRTTCQLLEMTQL